MFSCRLLILTLLLTDVIGLPPILVKQPVESKIYFKVVNDASGRPHRKFELTCECDATPQAKYVFCLLCGRYDELFDVVL